MTGRVRPRTRRPAVAGLFYAADPAELSAVVDGLLDAATDATAAAGPARRRPPCALIVPHAAYRYSGAVAASAYTRLPRRGHGDTVRRIVVLGPAHHVPLSGMAVSGAEAFDTPLGPVPVDAGLREVVAGLPGVIADDEPHLDEHAIEVQLPFLLRVLGRDISLVPVVVGPTRPESVADLIDACGAGTDPGTLVVISTDLSHYEEQARARARDLRTAAAVVARDVLAIGLQDACGCHPLRGLLAWTVRHDLEVELLDLRTSADAGGDVRRVVGYGAFAAYPTPG